MTSATGVRLQIRIGATGLSPAPAEVVRAFRGIEVHYGESGTMSFSASFATGRGVRGGAINYDLLQLGVFHPFNRIRVALDVGSMPFQLMDGFITDVRLEPGNQPGTSTLTVVGEDVSAMMALEQRAASHPGLDHSGIVRKIIARYARYGVRPDVTSSAIKQPPAPDANEVQMGSDLAYVRDLARRNAYVFQVLPGAAGPTAYWGPPQSLAVPQPALSIATGIGSNVDGLAFDNDALAAQRFAGSIQDPKTGQVRKIAVGKGTDPPLARRSAWESLGANVRTSRVVASGASVRAGLAEATARATASARQAVIAQGELDTMRYGHVLMPYRLVGVRGAGADYDGTYHVSSVTHRIKPGSYRQSFSLNRDGIGTRLPVVRP